jgi:hypothetical protein
MNERRTSARTRQLKAGSIVFNSAQSTFSCTVRNVSAAGACLMVTSPLTVPAAFDLLVAGERKPCAIAWRLPDRVGVQYQ